jgi:hypothetical protein
MNAALLGTEWRAYASIVRLSVQERAGKGRNSLGMTLAVCAALMAALGVVFRHSIFVEFAILVTGLAGGMLVVLWWLLLLSSVVQQNAGQGQLVPGIGRRSIKVLAIAWLCGVVCITLPFAFLKVPLLTVAFFAALLMACIPLAMLRPLAGFLLLYIVIAPGLIEKWWMPLSPGVVLAGRIGFGVLALYLTLRVLRGKSTGFVQRAMMRIVAVERTRAVGAAQPVGDCRPGDAGKMLLFCLGPATRMISVKSAAAMLAVLLAVSLAAPSLVDWYRGFLLLHFVLPLIVILLQLVEAYFMGTLVRLRSGEQALVMLSARRPPKTEVNALLARGMMWQFGRSWLASTLALLMVAAILGTPFGELTWIAAVCLSTLAGATLMLRDYAAPPQSGKALATLIFIGADVTVAAAIITAAAPAPALAFAAGWLAFTAMLFALRWRAMLRAPVAFPARRFA